MKYISPTLKNDAWHDCKEEMPATTTDVEFLDKDGNIIRNGHIFVDMSGAYAALNVDGVCVWSSFDRYTHWRFLNNK